LVLDVADLSGCKALVKDVDLDHQIKALDRRCRAVRGASAAGTGGACVFGRAGDPS
jgi:hypothetical protein